MKRKMFKNSLGRLCTLHYTGLTTTTCAVAPVTGHLTHVTFFSSHKAPCHFRVSSSVASSTSQANSSSSRASTGQYAQLFAFFRITELVLKLHCAFWSPNMDLSILVVTWVKLLFSSVYWHTTPNLRLSCLHHVLSGYRV